MSIFLSYRRVDSSYALCLYPWLIQWFGRERVFWDRQDIEPAAVFDRVIERQIRASKALIVLVSDSWLSATDERGQRRIDSPEDWIHRETALALREELLIIPVLVGGMKPPAPQELPGPLREIARLQMIAMEGISFHDLLRERLERVMPVIPQAPAPGKRGKAARLQRRTGNLLKRQIQRIQVRAAELIEDDKLDRTVEELSEGSELVMALFDLLPGDTTLDAQLGYLFGTTSQSFMAAGDRERADRYRDLAATVFRRLLANPALSPADKASATNGIGSAHCDRGDPVTAIECHRAAVGIDPHYCYAWHDLFRSYCALAERGAINLTGMREAIDKARDTGAGRPGLDRKRLGELEGWFRKWQDQLGREPYRDVRDGTFRLVPQRLVLVVTEAPPRLAIFNVNSTIVHQVSAQATLAKLEAAVTTPSGDRLAFERGVLYDFRPSAEPWGQKMTARRASEEVAVPAGSSDLGIQFVNRHARADELWRPGRYSFDLSVQTTWCGGQLDARTTCSVEIDVSEAAWVRHWCGAPKAEWDRLDDRDGAVGIPVLGVACSSA